MICHDMLIAGARVVTGDRVIRADIVVDDGRIAAIVEADGQPSVPIRANKTITAAGHYAFPGVVDTHVHFRTPGLEHKETWHHASRAAVAGGVTTVFDMPNTAPALFRPSDAHRKHELIRETSLVDYRFHAGIDPANPDTIADFDPAVATTAKGFLAGHHTAPHVLTDPGALERAFEVAADCDITLLFHAEENAVFTLLDRWQGPPTRYEDYESRRPRSAAIIAVWRLIELARRHGTKTHVVHVSSREEADLLTAARADGVPITFEVLGHHLTFTDSDIGRLGARIRLSPSIRSADDRNRLWHAVISGHAATIGSDHAPHAPAEKLRAPADCPPGLPGVQELLPSVLTGLRARMRDEPIDSVLRIAARVLASGPADLFGIGSRKGRIAIGHDADIVLLDLNTPSMFSSSHVQSLCGWSAYEGSTMQCTVAKTVRRGAVVFQGGNDSSAWQFGVGGGQWVNPAADRSLVSATVDPA